MALRDAEIIQWTGRGLRNVGGAIGRTAERAAEIIVDGAEWVGDVADRVWDWITEHPTLAFVILGAATGGAGPLLGLLIAQHVEAGDTPGEVARIALDETLGLLGIAGALAGAPGVGRAASATRASLQALEADQPELAAALAEQAAAELPEGAITDALASAGLEIDALTLEEVQRLTALWRAIEDTTDDPEEQRELLEEALSDAYGLDEIPAAAAVPGPPPAPSPAPGRDSDGRGTPLRARQSAWVLSGRPGPTARAQREADTSPSAVYL